MYIARPPISLKKITLEDYHGKVLFHTSYNEDVADADVLNEYFPHGRDLQERKSKALRLTRF
ncbi:unnamed protein product, partial [marine sediment metagenome]